MIRLKVYNKALRHVSESSTASRLSDYTNVTQSEVSEKIATQFIDNDDYTDDVEMLMNYARGVAKNPKNSS